MNSPESLREFTHQLVRRGLPVEYAERAAAELADHHGDLVEELVDSGLDQAAASAAATNRLGETKTLVKQTVRAYQRRHWCGRWPMVTFLLGPLALLVVFWAVSYLVAGVVALGAIRIFGVEDTSNDGVVSTAESICMYGMISWCLLAAPMIIVVVLTQRAFRAGLTPLWVALAALILSVVAGNIRCGFTQQISNSKPINTETGESLSPDAFLVSLPYWLSCQTWSSFWSWYVSNPMQAAQSLAPLAVAGLLIALNWRGRYTALEIC